MRTAAKTDRSSDTRYAWDARYALLHVLNDLPVQEGVLLPPSTSLRLYVEGLYVGHREPVFAPTIEERAAQYFSSRHRTPRGWQPAHARVINTGTIRAGVVHPDAQPLVALAVAGMLRREGIEARVEGFPDGQLYGAAGRFDTLHPVDLAQPLGNRHLSFSVVLLPPVGELYELAARDELPSATPVLWHTAGDGLVNVLEGEQVQPYKNGWPLLEQECLKLSSDIVVSQGYGKPVSAPVYYFTGSREALLDMLATQGWVVPDDLPRPVASVASLPEYASVTGADAATFLKARALPLPVPR